MSTPAVLGAPGKYKVIWQIVSADGHVVSDEYSFTWAPATGTNPKVSVGTSHPLDCDGRSGGTAPPDPNLGQDAYAQPHANLALVLGIGGGVLALGVILALVLLLIGRRRKPIEAEAANSEPSDSE
jgi:copper resistance protein C